MKQLFKYFLLIGVILPLLAVGADAQLRLKRQIAGSGGGMVGSKSSSGMTMSGLMSQTAIELKQASGMNLYQGFWTPNPDLVTSVDDDLWVSTNSQLTNFPNPFNASTTIKYTLPGAANVTLKIYDLLGNEIIKLYDGFQDGGEKQISWNAKDSRGLDLSNGSYLCELVVRPAQLAGGASFSAYNLRSVMVHVK